MCNLVASPLNGSVIRIGYLYDWWCVVHGTLEIFMYCFCNLFGCRGILVIVYFLVPRQDFIHADRSPHTLA